MAEPLTFQEMILTLQQFWSRRGCTIWQPYSEKVGAGTYNPATFLRVLGPEPWNVAYVEPSYRPDDGRYGDNPNRMQMFTQFQVILKPDPGDPQEQYLESLFALGITREEHDIRFVEDNWESPALGAWGLGWEVQLDGVEITQFTYFQQAGGFDLDPVSVEITYGLERIATFLQEVRSVWEIDWDGVHTYGDILLQPEIENCRYGFEMADVERLSQLFSLFEAEAQSCLQHGLVIPALDYVLRCSHTFNLLDVRGAIGVTERATFFRRMRDISREVAKAYVQQRKRMEYPWLGATQEQKPRRAATGVAGAPESTAQPQTLLLEIGTEELPARDIDAALAQLNRQSVALLEEARLKYEGLRIVGTPRRLAVLVDGLASHQQPLEQVVKGPPARVAYDDDGRPTRAAAGFARKQGVSVDSLDVRDIGDGEYVVAVRREAGRSALEILPVMLPRLIAGLRFRKGMRWNSTDTLFSRPIRSLVALLGEQIIPFEYAGLSSGRASRGTRPEGSPEFEVSRAAEYDALLAQHHIVADPGERGAVIAARAAELAESVGGRIPDDPDLLAEVANLVEQPTPFLGRFEDTFLRLPKEVLIAVMEKHQRYLPVVDGDGTLLPCFVVVRNGGSEHLDIVRRGNEEVIRARFADADFFFREDTKEPLATFLPRLATLTFQERLGSMLDKSQRLERLVPIVAGMVGLSDAENKAAQRAAHLCKADLATQMVVEMTSLQGVMGREYALKSGEDHAVSSAIFEHYLPRSAGDALSQTPAGLVLGLADRLDSLAGLFAVGLTPTGSADPYGLRRSALGIVQNLLANEVSFSVEEGLREAANLLPVEASEPTRADALGFVIDRLRVSLRERGFRYDVVDAVLAARGDDPFRSYQAVTELSRWTERDDWGQILAAHARCVRITRDYEQRFSLEPSRFVKPAEGELHSAYRVARGQVSPQSSVDEFFAAFTPLIGPIDRFFDRESGVMVMAEDRSLRENRLALLQHIAALAHRIADLSVLEGF